VSSLKHLQILLQQHVIRRLWGSFRDARAVQGGVADGRPVRGHRPELRRPLGTSRQHMSKNARFLLSVRISAISEVASRGEKAHAEQPLQLPAARLKAVLQQKSRQAESRVIVDLRVVHHVPHTIEQGRILNDDGREIDMAQGHLELPRFE
ncbi:hypothetical protein PENTCL1PPCAC_7852, partial [Pristionchus entomophagus]